VLDPCGGIIGLSIDAEGALMIDRSELMGNEKWKAKLEPTGIDIMVMIPYDTLIVTYIVSRRQSSIYVMYGSRYMKSVIYHAPKTALENVYVIFGL